MANSVYYSDNYESFDEWLHLVKNKENVYPFCVIPYEEWVENYIDEINERSIEDVKELLRCLLGPINRNSDFEDYKLFKALKESISDKALELLDPNFVKYIKKPKKTERYARIENGYDAWESITWVLELLPHRPYKAIEALEAYTLAQPNLPDDRIDGIQQCIDIIGA